MTTIDTRELIPIPDYKQMNIEHLRQLKASLWHSITKQQSGVIAMHHEYNLVSIALKDLEGVVEPPRPPNTDLDEPEYSAWVQRGDV